MPAITQSAPPFTLKGVDGRTYTLADFKEPVLVVIFSCNHCPYVRAYEDRMIQLQKDYAGKARFVLINSNDSVSYPEDGFEAMVARAKEKSYPFPYLRDETQEIARAYGAVRTPHLFVFDGNRHLAYTGKLDDNWQDPGAVKKNYLKDALDALTAGKPVAEPETPAIGCTIKWK